MASAATRKERVRGAKQARVHVNKARYIKFIDFDLRLLLQIKKY